MIHEMLSFDTIEMFSCASPPANRKMQLPNNVDSQQHRTLETVRFNVPGDTGDNTDRADQRHHLEWTVNHKFEQRGDRD